jgi:hypothetical protein
MPLHLTKVAVGCGDIDGLRERQQQRLHDGEFRHLTRYQPKRAGELIGGSLFWIIRHSLVARQEVLGFAEAATDAGTRCAIRLSPLLVPVQPRALRAHQGWRYLEDGNAPADLGSDREGFGALPAGLLRELSALGLI